MQKDNNLYCQCCGDVIRRLSDNELRNMSYNPYNWIEFCFACKKQNFHIDPEFRDYE